jgi:hypothetical protein
MNIVVRLLLFSSCYDPSHFCRQRSDFTSTVIGQSNAALTSAPLDSAIESPKTLIAAVVLGTGRTCFQDCGVQHGVIQILFRTKQNQGFVRPVRTRHVHNRTLVDGWLDGWVFGPQKQFHKLVDWTTAISFPCVPAIIVACLSSMFVGFTLATMPRRWRQHRANHEFNAADNTMLLKQ